jgi:hypothetical protein
MFRKLLFVVVLFPFISFGQTDGDYRTDQAGTWSAATSWEVFVSGAWQKLENASAGIYQNITPTDASGAISILHNTSISTASISADQLTINTGFTLTIAATRVLTIEDGAGDDLINFGTITTTGTLFISPNATYNHARDGGTIPLATWGSNSTCYVSGTTATNPTLLPANAYENFTWDCAQTGTRSLASNLHTVNGSLLILNTNGQQLQFGTGTAFTLNIGVDFTIQGNSRIAFATTANPVVVNLTGNFDYSSTGTSSLKSSGIFTFTIGGSFSQSGGNITISTGANTGTFNLEGDFNQSAGTLTRSGGTGAIVFNGTGGAQNITSLGTISSTVNFTVTNTSGVILNSNLSLPAALTQNSGSGMIDLNGNQLSINGNLTQTSGTIGVNTTAQLILQGSGTLPAGAISFSGTDLLSLEINQTGTLTTSSAIAITNLNLLNGIFTSTTVSMQPGGQITRLGGSITNTPGGSSYDVLYTNTANINTGPELPSTASVLNNLIKQGAGVTTLNQSLVTVNGNLTLSAGTFAVGTNSVSLAGNFISNATLTTGAGATFTFIGTTNLSGSVSPTFRNIQVNGTFTPSISYGVNENYTVSGTVNAGSGTVTFGGTTVVTNSGTMNLNAVTIAATFTMTAPSTTMGIAGNFTSTGTFNNGSGTILFNGTSNLTATEVYNNVTVTGTVTSTGNFSQTIAGNLINNGSFSIGTGNLTWSGSGTISGSGNTIAADLSVTGTSCTYTASGDLTLNDDLLGSGTFDSSGGSGTVIFAGAASAINRTGATTFRNMTVSGTLTPNTSYALSGAGSLVVNGTLVSGTTVTFSGTTQSISGTSVAIAFNNVTTNVGSTLTITPDITINGNLVGNGNISSSGTINFVGLTMSGTGTKAFTNVIVGTGTLTPNASYSISGNLAVNGTLAAGNATTTFNGNTTISGAGSATFNFLTISGILTSSSGTISVVRDFTNNGTFNHGNGTVSFNTAGTVQQQILGTSSTVFNNLVIHNVGVAVDITNGVTGGATVDIAGALSFGETNSVIDADGSGTSILRFLSTSDNPSTDGRVAAISFAGSSISGNITVQRFISSENRIYRYISSPVVGATVAQFQAAVPVTGTFTDPSNGTSSPPCTGCNSTNPSLFSFNEATNAYVAFPASGLASANAFTNGRGYSGFFRHTGAGGVGTVTVNFRGTHPSTAGVTLPVSPNALGYSLVGNPYPSPIVWNNGAGWVKTNIGDVIVVRDNATGVHQSHGTADNFIIAPGQSFWVQSTAGSASLQIREAAKTSGSYSFYRLDEPMVDQVEFSLVKAATNASATAKISIVPTSLPSYDSFDGESFDNNISASNNDGEAAALIQVQDITILSSDARKLVVNAIPSIACGQQFNISLKDLVLSSETVVNYSLAINPTGSLKAISWTLRDKYLNQDITISGSGIYEFTVTNAIAASKAADRFVLTASSALPIDVSKSVAALPRSECTTSDALVTVQSQPGVTYGVEVNGTLFPNMAQGNGNELSIPIESDKLAVGSNTIRLKANNGCASEFLTNTISLDRVAPYSINQVTNGALCSSGSVTLTASGAPADAVIRWYDSELGSNPIATGSEFITPILSDSVTRYFVAASRPNGCEGDRLLAKVEVTNLTDAFSAIQTQSACKSGSVTLQASTSLTNGTFKWYDQANSPTPIAEGQEFSVNNLASSRVYFVSFTSNSGCESARLPITASVSEFNPSFNVSQDKVVVCPGDRHVLFASGAANATYEWFTSIGSTTPIAVSSQFITDPLSASTDYYVRAVSDGGCVSDRMKVTAPISAGVNPTTIDFSTVSICREGESTLQPINGPSSASYRWYNSMSDSNPIFEGKVFTSGSLSADTKFYVSAKDANGCESALRKEVKVQVTAYQEPVIQVSGDGSLKSNFTTGNTWYLNGTQLANETFQFLQVKESGDYTVKIDYQGCSEFSGAVNVTTLITGLEESNYEYNVYPNPVSDILQIRVKDATPVLRAYVVNSTGAKIAEIPMNKSLEEWSGEIDLRNVSKGLYIIQLMAGERSVTHKIIVK